MWDKINNSEKKKLSGWFGALGKFSTLNHPIKRSCDRTYPKKKKVAANKFGTTLNHPIKRSCERAQKKIAANKFGK